MYSAVIDFFHFILIYGFSRNATVLLLEKFEDVFYSLRSVSSEKWCTWQIGGWGAWRHIAIYSG
jgi:hypothetical protein